jgi:hypothetical protein
MADAHPPQHRNLQPRDHDFPEEHAQYHWLGAAEAQRQVTKNLYDMLPPRTGDTPPIEREDLPTNCPSTKSKLAAECIENEGNLQMPLVPKH